MTATRVEETGLATITERSDELAPTAASAERQYEIQSAIVVARKFPRNENAAFEKLMKACRRSSFAEEAAYSFPRGGTNVTGPSVNLAREAARIWGNVRHGLEIVRDDEESRQIRGWAYDVETNTKVSAEDDFRKLIYRKGKDGGGVWIKPDERDLRELTFRRGAILIRNCILQILPRDLVEDALRESSHTLRQAAKMDPEATRKRLILAFSELNVTVDMMEKKLGHPIGEITPDELEELRKIHRSIADGNSTWREYVNGEGAKKEPEKALLTVDDLKPSEDENRGHEEAGLDLKPASDEQLEELRELVEMLASKKDAAAITREVKAGMSATRCEELIRDFLQHREASVDE